MGRAVCADKPRAIHGEADRQFLDRHVVHHLIVPTLQEGGVNGAERLHPIRRQPGREGHRVLLGDADVERARREPLGEDVDASA